MDNHITNDIRDITYDRATPVQKSLYASSDSGLKLRTMAQKYDLHKGDVYKKFATTVGDIILGFYRIEDTVPLLQQELGVNPRTAALLGADVLDFLTPLSDPNWQPPMPPATKVTTPTTPTPMSSMTAVTPALSYPPTTATGHTQTSEPVGTETLYKSEQPTARIPLSAVPSYSHPTPHQPPSPISLEQPPRWGA